jgi:hypothetical protein
MNEKLMFLFEKLKNDFNEINIKDDKVFLFENDTLNYIEFVETLKGEKLCLNYNFFRSYGYLFRKDEKALLRLIRNNKKFFQKEIINLISK